MSIASEISRINGNIADAYDVLESKGATMPAVANSANLGNTIESIPQGGSADAYTRAQTDALLDEKAPVIECETELSCDTDLSAFTSSELLAVSVKDTSLNYPYILLSQGANLLPAFTTVSPLGETNGLTIEYLGDNAVKVSGSCTEKTYIFFRVIASSNQFTLNKAVEENGTVTAGALVKGQVSGSAKPYTVYKFIDTNQTIRNVNINYTQSSLYTKQSVTLTGDCSRMTYLQFVIPVGAVLDNCIVTPYIFAADDIDVIEAPVYSQDLMYDLDIAVLGSYLSTYPNQHKIVYRADTKEYIDSRVPEIDMSVIEAEIDAALDTAVGTKITYITPEMYGAKGDGVTDDTAALQNCLSRANSNVLVRALKHYKITSPVQISANHTCVEINRITYTGEDFALKIATRFSRIQVMRLNAESGKGVLIRNDNTALMTDGNRFGFGMIRSYGDCIKFETTDGAAHRIAYNRFTVPYLYSSSANLININSSCVETAFYGGKIDSPNGWCVYDSTATNSYINFAFENTLDICYGTGKFINCRTIEALDSKNKGREGVFVKLTRTSNIHGTMISDQNTPVSYVSVDVSELNSFDDAMDELARRVAELDPDEADGDDYYGTCYDVVMYQPAIISNIMRYSGYIQGVEGDTRLCGKMVVYWNRKAYVPNSDVMEDITVTPFVPLTTVRTNPTYFRIGVADCVINLNDSYCPVGIDSFIVEQTNDYKATIYNKDNTLIFDGASKPAGKYLVRCYITPVTSNIFDDIVNMPAAVKSMYANRIRNIYTGTNEAWVVTPLDA